MLWLNHLELLHIAPGTSQSGYFLAQGNTITPASCTFNGVACVNYTGYNNTGYNDAGYTSW